MRLIVIFAICLIAAVPARSGIHLVEDEVIFTLVAPGAKTVYLVGTFNNWNPTVELMAREDDTFTAALFLAAEEYHYKFVVDGTWITDPDNPPKDPEKGSPLFLVERGGILTIRSNILDTALEEKAFLPGMRYRGTALTDDGEEDVKQEIDLMFRVGNDFARAKAILKTRDDSWRLSPLGADVRFDRGSLEMKTATGTILGFENDSLWTSRDPFHLFGTVGIYEQNFGFGRRGIAIEQAISKVFLRAVYSDRTGDGRTAAGSISAGDVASQIVSAASSNVVYRVDPDLAGEDVVGGELFLDAGTVVIGYGRRENRGMNAGLLAEFEMGDTVSTAKLFTTREYWNGSIVWLEAQLSGSLAASFGYGSGTADVLRLSRSVTRFEEPQELIPGADAVFAGQRSTFQKSRRWKGGLQYRKERLECALDVERSSFEYLRPVFDPSDADIWAASLGIKYRMDGWSIAGTAHYTDQRYRNTPRDFHVDAQERNYWLDYADQLTVERMVGFDLDRFGVYTGSVAWNRETLLFPPYSREPEAQSLFGSVGCVVEEFAGSFQAVFARAAYERFIARLFYVQLDGRLASYPGAEWSDEQTFFSTYIEAGYRSGRMELSLGFGFDPVAFDDRSNEYLDAGRTEFLRGAAAGSRIRDLRYAGWMPRDEDSGLASPTVMEYNLLRLEKLLEETRIVKLEWIIVF